MRTEEEHKRILLIAAKNAEHWSEANVRKRAAQKLEEELEEARIEEARAIALQPEIEACSCALKKLIEKYPDVAWTVLQHYSQRTGAWEEDDY